MKTFMFLNNPLLTKGKQSSKTNVDEDKKRDMLVPAKLLEKHIKKTVKRFGDNSSKGDQKN